MEDSGSVSWNTDLKGKQTVKELFGGGISMTISDESSKPYDLLPVE
jgi:hypothetical protein